MKIAIIIIVIACVAFYFYSSANNKKNAVINHEQGSAFLADNAQKEGVKTTASGLQYLVLQQGSGDRHPTATSTVRVHYHGTLVNGTVFDSSVERGETISFPLNRVIPGWTEGVQLMKVGDKFRFFIPSGLGYGNRSAGKIPAGSVLIFDVELFEIQ
jgi:peptidylprolyl isomerase